MDSWNFFSRNSVKTFVVPVSTMFFVIAAARSETSLCDEPLHQAKTCDDGLQMVHLNDDDWTLTERTRGIAIPATVPGSMYTALLQRGLIQDPLFRDNDVKYTWISLANWTYTKSFSAPEELSTKKRVLLICEGLDTVASVVLNGQILGHTDNMYVRYVFDVAGHIQPLNKLQISFTSAVTEAAERANLSSYVIPPVCPPEVQHGQCHVNQIRKEPCSFSWDWGPAFPTQGVWKPIYIESFSSAVLRDVSAIVTYENSQWTVVVESFFDVVLGHQVKGQLEVSLPGLNVTLKKEVTVSEGSSFDQWSVAIPAKIKVARWWPNGYGKQALYDLIVTFTTTLDKTQRRKQIGFRTVKLIQDPVSYKDRSLGLTFYFEVNGLPIFLKGSNWIPADSFQERITTGRLSYLLRSAADVGLNSMRVWGGGVYESDEFYALCDQLGILVWQDFMFSCALYPSYDQFLASVSTEISQQVRRLKHHPSILVWAGNNENEKALRQNWYKTDKHFSLYYDDYIKLYVTTIKPIVTTEDISRDYVVSSPSDGAESEREHYVAKDPGSELFGDIHFYDYAADQWNTSVFRIPRMASEYGIQAWCNNESLARVFLPSDLDMDSDMVNHRQHHGNGNLEMQAEVGIHLNMPTSLVKEKFANFIYLTQINQAMSIRTQTEHYRRHQSSLLPDGRGLTMGALIWQLNDIWQAPTWASIDYEGRWKMLHYYTRWFFQPTLVSPYFKDEDTLEVYLVVDQIPTISLRNQNGELQFQPMTHIEDFIQSSIPLEDVVHTMRAISKATQGKLSVAMYSYSSFTPLHTWSLNYKIRKTSESIYTTSVSELLQESGCPDPQSCFLTFDTYDDLDSSLVSQSWLMLTYPKDAKLAQAHVQISNVTKTSPKEFKISLSSNTIALYVWLSAGVELGRFSDNGFLLHKPNIDIVFYSYRDLSVFELQKVLTVRSLTDVE